MRRTSVIWSIFVLFLYFAEIGAQDLSEPLVIGETLTIESKALDEARRINVYYLMPSQGPYFHYASRSMKLVEMIRRVPWQVSLGSRDLLVETCVRETGSCLGGGHGSWYDI